MGPQNVFKLYEFNYIYFMSVQYSNSHKNKMHFGARAHI